ncbi:hypothetical protein V8C35DRAFT_315495 [Trichoderma chlorosporum]
MGNPCSAPDSEYWRLGSATAKELGLNSGQFHLIRPLTAESTCRRYDAFRANA